MRHPALRNNTCTAIIISHASSHPRPQSALHRLHSAPQPAPTAACSPRLCHSPLHPLAHVPCPCTRARPCRAFARTITAVAVRELPRAASVHPVVARQPAVEKAGSSGCGSWLADERCCCAVVVAEVLASGVQLVEYRDAICVHGCWG
jgi:hypothetical protein